MAGRTYATKRSIYASDTNTPNASIPSPRPLRAGAKFPRGFLKGTKKISLVFYGIFFCASLFVWALIF